MKHPTVSVCITTYNHQSFIERCILSVLKQADEVDLEIIVGDDCSTDRTGEIVDRLARNYDRICVFRPKNNSGPTKNLLSIHNMAKGEFIAYLDGDDWAAPGKLSAQVALLRARPEIVACGHRMIFVDETGAPTGHSFPKSLGDTVTLDQTVRWGMPFMASSLLYRRDARLLKTFEGELFDWYFLTDILQNGPSGYIDASLGFYTVNSTSLSATLKRRAMREKMLGLYAKRLEGEPRLKSDIFAYTITAALSCVKQRDPVTARHSRLLLNSLCFEGIKKTPETIIRALSNAPALAR